VAGDDRDGDDELMNKIACKNGILYRDYSYKTKLACVLFCGQSPSRTGGSELSSSPSTLSDPQQPI
jgi:hypothetical protein